MKKSEVVEMEEEICARCGSSKVRRVETAAHPQGYYYHCEMCGFDFIFGRIRG
jgi:predicted RNA-binding Zn-ribbon protein involved in translation (DUF1610 family)